MFSNSVKYALKAVLYIAMNSDENTLVMVKDISEAINAPQPYLAKLLQELSKRKLISSKKGPKGGFFLSVDNKKVTVLSIISALDGDKMDICILGLTNCNENHPCPLHKTAYPYKSKLKNKLKGMTIDELSIGIKLGQTFLPL